MTVGETIKTTLDRLQESASVRSVYGDPIAAEGKTIIPVARIAYGFGGGFGSAEDDDEGGEGGEGGGGGGGVSATPVGVVEVTEDETRFVRYTSWKRLALAVAAGVALGALLGRR